MGLDSVEIVIAVEDEFKIALSNEEASKVVTVGDLVALGYSRMRHHERETCPSQHAFYVIRRRPPGPVFAGTGGLSRLSVRL